MAQISVNNLTFCYEGNFDNIFEEVSFSIDTNWKLGFIGRNGKGKTTFLNLLLGKYSYTGSIDAAVLFAYFPYQVTECQARLPAADFLEELKTGCEEWRVVCELAQLGESAEILYRPYHTLSFGEQTKIMLAVLFSGENHFLLIDEPTNHLDYDAREIVKAYLASKKGFILVSHDRDLLDACIDHVLVLNRQSIEVQRGNFSSWWENRQRKNQFEQAENEKHLKEIQKLKQAASRTTEWADKSERAKIGFDPRKEPDRFAGTRAYIGAKTKKMQSQATQMKTRIQKELEEKGGLSEFCKSRNLDQSLFYSILRQLDFERVQFLKPMEDYSEGQKKKVLLAASLLTPAHLYIWDEPLNYIDVFSRMQIEKLLLEYQPTMLFVEHGAKFRVKVAVKTIELCDY